MYNVGLVDDEKHARETLKTLLKQIKPEIEILFEAQSPNEAIEMLEKFSIDILFLDIHLKNGNGFQILEKIKERKFHIIFVTAYNQYAIDAFRFSALHYILKPFCLSDLKECINRVETLKLNYYKAEQYHILKNILQKTEPHIKKICIPYGNEKLFLNLSDIIRLEASSNYTWFIVKDNRYLISKTLKEYEDLLCKNGFIRVHQSHIINPEYMIKYHKSGGGEIIMADSSIIPIARNRKNKFLRIMKL
ncbi:MAG: LytTR family transcriptional regulator DNA-binding domain-containing protein [Bacteroidales bacterium]